MSQIIYDKLIRIAQHTILFYSVLAGLVVALSVSLAWYILDTRERELIDRVTEVTARGVETLIKKDIESRVVSLSGLAQNWELSNRISRKDWETIATNIYEAQPGYQSIGWIDTSLHIRWIVPLEGNEAALNFDLRSNPPALIAAQAAQDRGTVVFTVPLDSIHGGKGLGIYFPIYNSGSDARLFDGLMGSVLLLNQLFESVLPFDLIAEHHVSVFINGKTLYSTDPEHRKEDPLWKKQRQFNLYGLTWQLEVTPKTEFLLKAYFRFSTVMLTLLLLLSSLASLFVYFVLISRKRTQQVRNNASHLDRLFKNLPGMSYRCIEHYPWPMEFVSYGCQALCGYKRHELENHQVLWGELIHLDDQDRVKKAVANAVIDEKHFSLEYRILTRSGTERWIWDQCDVIAGNITHENMLEGFITDITDRKQAELALIEARAYLEAVVDTAAEAVITIDSNGAIETFNLAAMKMFGYSLEDVQGKNVSVLMPQPHRHQHDDFIDHYLNTGEARIIGIGRDMSAQRKDGSVFPIHLSVSEVDYQAKRMFVGLIRDISKQKAAEIEVREHQEKLAHIDRLNTLGEMATGIAHEINQPLSAISLFSQAGKRFVESGSEEKLPEIFDKISQHAQRAGAIIERIQTMTRQHISTHKIIECNSLIKEVALLAEADARIQDIVIELELGDELPLVSVDSVQIQQVALNLLRNGMQAMQSVNCAHGDTITLQTHLREEGIIEISIVDSGCGVSESVLENIFEPFSTTKEAGMGIGLSICRSIILTHGGEIYFKNNDLNGATFSFTLPTTNQKKRDTSLINFL